MAGDNTTVVDFVQFLLDREEIGQRYADQVRLRASQERAPIGQLLIRRGVLKIREVMKVLELQSETPGVLFGDLAVRSGFLSARDLEDILEYQRNHRLHQIEIIYAEKLMSEARCFHLVVSYIRYLETHVRDGSADTTLSIVGL